MKEGWGTAHDYCYRPANPRDPYTFEEIIHHADIVAIVKIINTKAKGNEKDHYGSYCWAQLEIEKIFKQNSNFFELHDKTWLKLMYSARSIKAADEIATLDHCYTKPLGQYLIMGSIISEDKRDENKYILVTHDEFSERSCYPIYSIN